MGLTKVMKIVVSILALLLSVSCAKKEVSFKNDVRPILQANCVSCHVAGGQGFAASGFSMESYESLMKGTKFGAVIIPGSSISSTLVILIEGKADHSINMPRSTGDVPRQPLAGKEIALIKSWIDQGAKDN